MTATRRTLAYLRGDDTYGIERETVNVANRILAETGAAPERWRITGAETSADAIRERITTTPMFGGGTLAIVSEPGPLVRSKADREALVACLSLLAPGNGLVFIESVDGKRPVSLEGLEAAVRDAGGTSRAFEMPKADALAAWIEERAAERSVRLGPGAAKELAQRVGGFVREGDIDRRGQSALAVGELDKLALYRPGEPVTVEDVAALVPEVVPDSTWAMLDAVGSRRLREAAPLLDRLLAVTPEPVILAVLHRRVRELLELADRLDGGDALPAAARAMGIRSEFRARTLAVQARAWTVPALENALEGLLGLDAMVKGAPDAASTDHQRRLAFLLWLEDRVGPGAGIRR